MLTTAIASVLTTAAIAQTTISGELRVSYKAATMDKGATGTGTKDTAYGFGSEQQINIQTKGKLNLGGLDYAAGMSIENDGEQQNESIFDENVYMDLTNASTGTTISLGRDHIQRSDTDYSATNLVGFTPNEMSAGTNGTSFTQTPGAGPSQEFGIAVIQDVGTFGKVSYNFVPNNSKVTSVKTTNSLAASEGVNANSTSAYEYGFVGGLGVKGLTVHYFKNENSDFETAANQVKAEGKNYGVKYNFGQITVGANKKKHQVETTNALAYTDATTANKGEIEETALAIAYAINNNLTIGVMHAKAEHPAVAVALKDQKTKGINLGYNLGPVNLALGYAKTENAAGLSGSDNDVFMGRLIGAF